MRQSRDDLQAVPIGPRVVKREDLVGLIRLVFVCLASAGIALGSACKEPVIASTQASSGPSNGTERGRPAGPGPEGDSTKRDDSAGLPPKVEVDPKAADTVTVSGLLKSGYMAVGGEHTGWKLLQSGKKGDAIEVDVSKVLSEAKQLDGQAVTITGRMVDKSYVERGSVRILVAASLVAGPT